MKRVWWGVLAVLALLALAGCLLLAIVWADSTQFLDSDQPQQGPETGLSLDPEGPVGQTFVARHDGLDGIDFFLWPTNQSPHTLSLHLRADPSSNADLATASLELPQGAAPGFYRFSFPQQPTSHGQYYYAFVEAAAPGVSMALAEGDAYLDGAAHQAHQPLDAQTSFRLVYAPRHVVRDLLGAALGWAGLLASAGLLLVVPGWALLAWLWQPRQQPGRRLSWAEMLGLAVGISVALYPLLILWTGVVGLHLGPLYAWLPIALGVAALVWRYRTWRPRKGWEAARHWARSDALWPDLALLSILALVFGVRFLIIRTLDAPLWGDSYQHTMIAQLLVDNGGLFDSWAPYAELDRFTYHFGFHSAVAGLQWLTGATSMVATLWTGQILNGLAVLAIYPLAVRVTGSRWGGVWAVLLAGLLSPMPMFYVNWGRYTQLAGLVILPTAVWFTWTAVEMPERHWRLVALVALLGGGLALTHYRVLIFYGVFALALALLSLGGGKWRETLLRLGSAAMAAGFLYLPWFAHAFGAGFLQIFWLQVTTPPAQSHPFTWESNTVGSLDTYLAPVWWLAVPVGIGLGLWRRHRAVLLIALWWFLLLIATNPAWLALPGTGVITNFALVLAVYLPASLFAGYLAAGLIQPAARRRWTGVAFALLIVGLGVWGARERLGDLDPNSHALVTRPDVRAAHWIRENTASSANFLANSFFAYGGYAIVGADAGWWLPLLAERQNTVPPLSYSSELGPESDYRQRVEGLARQVQARDWDDPALLDLFRQDAITHVYIGQRQGRVNYNGPSVLEPAELLDSPYYRPVYHQDRVWIFEIIPEP